MLSVFLVTICGNLSSACCWCFHQPSLMLSPARVQFFLKLFHIISHINTHSVYLTSTASRIIFHGLVEKRQTCYLSLHWIFYLGLDSVCWWFRWPNVWLLYSSLVGLHPIMHRLVWCHGFSLTFSPINMVLSV